ncbi:hypothetical protein CSKR_110614 [Clonorchis sinensis]|uniref:Uncharacterized protein n=1 Tax=Clonorchis sinensis TaxID=79923 RepID=A0A3R7C412_CLOSI|nr:hypothetical protein CSKR_110614 [Clonorchis sinensis]
MHHWQPAIGQYWVMIGCWVQIFDQSDLGLMPDRQASRIPGQSCVSALCRHIVDNQHPSGKDKYQACTLYLRSEHVKPSKM